MPGSSDGRSRGVPIEDSAMSTETHTFTLLLQGADPLTPEHLDAMFEAGCDDATFGRRDSLYYADFDREAPSFAEAVGSAIRAVEGAVPGLKVVRVEPEELVSAAGIAARTGRSRESVRLLIHAKRGPGHFPPPAVWISDRRRLWRWSDVASWLVTYCGDQTAPARTGAFIAALNGALDVRLLAEHVLADTEREQLAWVIEQDASLLQGRAGADLGVARGGGRRAAGEGHSRSRAAASV
jgi:hypothetical protein